VGLDARSPVSPVEQRQTRARLLLPDADESAFAALQKDPWLLDVTEQEGADEPDRRARREPASGC
jgi:hypothetical protein